MANNLDRWGRLKLAYQLRRIQIFAHAWAFWIGVVSIVVAVAYFIDPNVLLHSTSVGLQLKGWAYAWNSLYLLGGLGIVIGLLTFNDALDALGCCLFAGAILIQALAVYESHPPNPVLGLAISLGFFSAALMRVRALMSKRLL